MTDGAPGEIAFTVHLSANATIEFLSLPQWLFCVSIKWSPPPGRQTEGNPKAERAKLSLGSILISHSHFPYLRALQKSQRRGLLGHVFHWGQTTKA